MPDEYSVVREARRNGKQPNDYSVARKQRSAKLPESDKKTLTPQYLLNHENHFDPNVFTPEQMIKGGVLKGDLDPVRGT
jgi:hypothetical protein